MLWAIAATGVASAAAPALVFLLLRGLVFHAVSQVLPQLPRPRYTAAGPKDRRVWTVRCG